MLTKILTVYTSGLKVGKWGNVCPCSEKSSHHKKEMVIIVMELLANHFAYMCVKSTHYMPHTYTCYMSIIY